MPQSTHLQFLYTPVPTPENEETKSRLVTVIIRHEFFVHHTPLTVNTRCLF